jgi:hypothetical protein
MTRSHRAARLIAMALAAGCAAAPLALAGAQRLVVRPSATDNEFSELLDRYARGDTVVRREAGGSTLELQRQLRRVGSSWIGPRNTPDGARRRLAVATFALEVIDAHFETAWRRGFSGDLLEWSCGLLRDVPASPGERTWHMAAVVLLERASAFRLIRGPVSVNGNSAFVTHVAHAERRFPGDGRWLLARAMDAEHATWPPAIDEDILRPLPDAENRIRSRLEAAFEHPDVAAEAHLRWGYFHVRRGRWERALAEFDAVGEPADRALRYWLHLFRGQTFVRLHRAPEAVASYRLALSAFPDAQAATLALSSMLLRDGQHAEASGLTTRLLAATVTDDPFRIYGFPASRDWPALVRGLRQAIAP